MVFQYGSRQDVLLSFSEQGSLNGQVKQALDPLSMREPKAGEVILLWSAESFDNLSVPVALIVRDNELTDFVAWAATYLSEFRPVTAFSHIVGWSTVSAFLDKSCRYVSSSSMASRASVGLIVAEAVGQSLGQLNPGSLQTQAYLNTFSFCIARSLFLGYISTDTDMVAKRWARVRELGGGAVSPALTVRDIESVWLVLLNLLGKSQSGALRVGLQGESEGDIFIQACREFCSSGEIAPDTWLHLTDGIPDLLNSRISVQGPREDRIEKFEKIVRGQALEALKRDKRSFVCAYLASRLNLGSLVYLDMLQRVHERFPTAVLWYGLLTGLFPRNDLGREFNGLGRRIMRDLGDSGGMLNRPRGDLSLEEFEALSKDSGSILDFRRGYSGHVVIDLFPGVLTSVKFARSVNPPQPTLFPDAETMEVRRKTLKELEEIRRRVEALYKLNSGEVSAEIRKGSPVQRRKTRRE